MWSLGFLEAQALEVSHPKLDALRICIYQKPQLLRLPIRQSSLATVPLQHWKRPGFGASTTQTKRIHPGRLTFWTWDYTPGKGKSSSKPSFSGSSCESERWCRQHRWVPSITKPGDGDGWSHFMPFKDLWCFFSELEKCFHCFSSFNRSHHTQSFEKNSLQIPLFRLAWFESTAKTTLNLCLTCITIRISIPC